MMRFPAKKKPVLVSNRQDELRKARVAAPTLRQACPEAALVRVELEFQANPLLANAPQTVSIYPPAKAHFAYACPFGDCDGVYDLSEVAFGTLSAGKRNARGTLLCSGHRPGRDTPCGLELSFSIAVRHNGNPRLVDESSESVS